MNVFLRMGFLRACLAALQGLSPVRGNTFRDSEQHRGSIIYPQFHPTMQASVGGCRPNYRNFAMQSIDILSIARAVLLAGLFFSASLLSAQPADGQGRKPPPEALDACKAAKAGQGCNFTSPKGTVNGTCFAPEGKPLACRPTKPTGGSRGGAEPSPPPGQRK